MSIFDELRKYCPQGTVKRQDLHILTGGILSPSSMSHLDIQGKGIDNRKVIGRNVVYDIDDVIKWLENNTTLVNFDK